MFTFVKRITLFLIVNFLVLFSVSIILNIFHVAPYLNRFGINYNTLLIFCLVWGMAGSFISLMLSKQMAKWMLGVKIVRKGDSSLTDELIKMVDELSRKAGMSRSPEVGVFHSTNSNAFATGPSKNSSLVAVSDHLLHRMDKEKLKAIIGHEISHIVNGDMVTMALLQGIVNAFVMFLARVLAFVFSGQSKSNNANSSYLGYYLFVMLFETVFMILGSMVVAAFSRFREYRADKGGALLTSKQSMIGALRDLEMEHVPAHANQGKMIEAFMIHSKKHGGLLRLFATHPSIEDRVHRIQMLNQGY
ncbi:MAG: protease HtpX [Chlamydiales bacterium]|nr:protease HtpX [Chlamydiales bacterium]